MSERNGETDDPVEPAQPGAGPPDPRRRRKAERRRFLGALLGFTFISGAAALGKQPAPVGENECGGSSNTGVGYAPDSDCEQTGTDSACGLRNTNPLGGAWGDDDCSATSTDNDCGKANIYYGSSSDSSCSATSTDNDCGKGVNYGQWTDQDCAATGEDNEHCNILDSCPLFDLPDDPDPPDDPLCLEVDTGT